MPAPHVFAAIGTPPQWIRPRRFAVTHIDLDLRIDAGIAEVHGTVIHHCRWINQARQWAEFDAGAIAIISTHVDGQAVTCERGERTVRVPISPTGATFTVTFTFFTRQPAKGLCFTPAQAGHGPIMWSQGAMEDHSAWFPCWDSPNNRSTWTVAICHPADQVGLSNGVQSARREHGDGWITTTWRHELPTVLYLLTVVVGDLVGVEDSAPSVPCTHWVPRGQEAAALSTFRATAFALDWLAKAIGSAYPWPRYGHVIAPDFWWGGMENATLTTIAARALASVEIQQREDVDADALIIHELVHQWFGDLVTMQGWSDIWLNESFATWLEARCTAAWRAHCNHSTAPDHLALALWENRSAWLDQDAQRYRRAVVTTVWADAYELFDRVAYEKGSLILEHWCDVIGEKAMAAALALYTTRHHGGLVSTPDWRRAVEDASGEPCDWLVEQWLIRDDHPVLAVSWTAESNDSTEIRSLLVTVEQTQPGAVFRVPTWLIWRDTAGVHRERLELREKHTRTTRPAAGSVSWVALDPDGILPAEITETEGAASALARVSDCDCPAAARARAAVILGNKKFSSEAMTVVVAIARDEHAPELVRRQILAALAASDQPEGRAALLALADLPAARLRRAVAEALASRIRNPVEAAAVALRCEALADGETSTAAAGAWLATRGALEHPGAVAVLRARMGRASWNQRLRQGAVSGLGRSGEASAIDEVLPILLDLSEVATVRATSAGGLATLALRHPLAALRIRRALADGLHDGLMPVRAACAKALGTIADPADVALLNQQREREPLGTVARVLREAASLCGKAADRVAAQAELRRQLEELTARVAKLEAR